MAAHVVPRPPRSGGAGRSPDGAAIPSGPSLPVTLLSSTLQTQEHTDGRSVGR